MRRLSTCVLATALLATAAPPQKARIKIDTDRITGEVDPHLFGNFTEHLGRCIYGGIYEEVSPLADADGYRKDVMEATRNLGVTMLRWPGGNFVSGYNWKDGIGPRDQRPVRPEGAWGSTESNRFGTNEFLNYCERLRVEPYICINAGLGSITEARDWVEYTNEMRDTYWAQQRKKNGRDKPWGVKYWGLGNELDGPWQLGHKNADDYSKFALEAAKAMRRVDGSIKLIASGSSNFGRGADWVGWNRTVLDYLKNDIDYISLHTYIGNQANDFQQFLSSGEDVDQRIEVVEGLIRAAQASQAAPRPIKIAYDEWNVWYRARGNGEFATGRTRLEEIYNYEDALAMGMFFNSFFRHADSVKMANLAQLVNVIAPIFTNEKGLFLQPIYFPIQEYGKQKGNQALDVLVQSPTYKVQRRPAPVKALDVSATYRAADGTMYVNVLNRSANDDIAASIENVAGAVASSAEVWQMSQDDLKESNTFGSERVHPVTRQATLAVSHGTFEYTFPKHSLTILKVTVK